MHDAPDFEINKSQALEARIDLMETAFSHRNAKRITDLTEH